MGRSFAFGRVMEGLDNVYKFKTVNRIRNPGGEATIINKATVLRDRGHEYEPEVIEDAASLIREQAKELMSVQPTGDSTPTQPPAAGSSNRKSAVA